MFKKKTAMKKTYQNPEIKVVKVQMAQMIAASTDVTLGGSYGGGEIQSRRNGSLWDDDDEY